MEKGYAQTNLIKHIENSNAGLLVFYSPFYPLFIWVFVSAPFCGIFISIEKERIIFRKFVKKIIKVISSKSLAHPSFCGLFSLSFLC